MTKEELTWKVCKGKIVKERLKDMLRVKESEKIEIEIKKRFGIHF